MPNSIVGNELLIYQFSNTYIHVYCYVTICYIRFTTLLRIVTACFEYTS